MLIRVDVYRREVNYVKNVFSQLLKKIRIKNEEKYIAEIRRKNNNNDPTIICNNCMGG